MKGRLLLLIGACVTAPVAHAQNDDVARRFGTLAGATQVSLSPDGEKLAFLAPSKGQGNDLYIVDIGEGAVPRRILRSSGDPEILFWCKWATTARLVCEIGGRENVGGDIMGFTSLLGVDASGGNVKTLSARRGANAIGYDFRGGEVIDWQPSAEGDLLITRSYVPEAGSTVIRKDGEGLGVDLVKATDGSAKTVEKPRRDAIEYVSDGKGQVRIMGLNSPTTYRGYADPLVRHMFRRKNSRDWEQLSSYDTLSMKGFYPYAVDITTDRAIGFANVDGRRAIVALSLDGAGKTEALFRHSEVDVDELVRVGRDQRVVGATYVTERRHMEITDPKVAAMAKSLSGALGGKDVYFIDASADEAHWLVWVGSDIDPGRYYRYTPSSKQLRPLLDERPLLADQALSPVKPIRYPASDGTMIPGYLTLPLGKVDAKGLPAIVMPHGGLAARDEWGFDWLAQYFARLGFAVVQPNYRGAAGYGDQWYMDNGFQSWRTAIGDVNDAGRWLLTEGADPAKLSIVGWHYGGYAALQSGATEPGLFRSIVAIAPITDLAQFKSRAMKFASGAVLRDFVGSGPHIREGSPAQNAANIKAPVLMFHGTFDQRANIEQARIMRRALADAGKSVELIEYPGLATSLNDSEARTAMLARITQFLPH